MQVDETPTLEELIAQYEFEPDARDIVVEGIFDKDLLNWLFHVTKTTDVIVYEVEDIIIPADVYIRHNKDSSSKKERVLTVALEVFREIPGIGNLLTCIVDADYDRFDGTMLQMPVLFYTDFTTMEMYLFNEPLLEKTMALATPAQLPPANALLKNLTPILTELYVIERARRKVCTKIGLPKLRKCCNVKEKTLFFDKVELFRRMPACNATEIDKEGKQLTIKFQPDNRHQMNGHDYTDLLAFYFEKATNSVWLESPEGIGRIMTAIAAEDLFLAEKLFNTVIARVQI